MRIVIDLQGAQGENRYRGIGRYSLSLARAISALGRHEVIIALSDAFPESIEHLRVIFSPLVGEENIRVWTVPVQLAQIESKNDRRRRGAEIVREAFLASLNPSIVLVCSLFEGLVDDVVSSVGSLNTSIPTAVVLYDLIPLINRSPYLDNPNIERWYENRLEHLRKADAILAISESSRREGLQHLLIPSDVISNISTAADEHFRAKLYTAEQRAELTGNYGLSKPFLMYTGGIDHRKNIEGLITAFAALPDVTKKAHQLAIVCSVQSADRIRLVDLAKKSGLTESEIVLTGFVPESDLVGLYNMCKAFVFPSWHEGFGLPALEAMRCGRAVIGANTSSVPEVIGLDKALFDPFDQTAFTHKINDVLSNDQFRAELEQHSIAQAQRFSWERTAIAAVDALENCFARQATALGQRPIQNTKPRLAYVSPLPPERSGISDYSAELLPELFRHYEIDVVAVQTSVTSDWITNNCAIRSTEWFEKNHHLFDRVLYHFGNSTFHLHMFHLLETIPGAVVLHDFFLSGIVAHMEFHGIEPLFWVNELYLGHGYKAVADRYNAKHQAEVIWKYPCNMSVLRNALGTIIHSDNSRRLATEWYGSGDQAEWADIPLLRVPDYSRPADKLAARAALGLDKDDFVVCSFGLLGPSKLNDRLIEAWAASPLSADGECVLIFVGENDANEYGARLLKDIKAMGSKARVSITGWVDTDVYKSYLVAADVGVQLRTLSRGETSAAVLDCMNYGLATIANANGSMADLPEDGVVRLPDAFEVPQLTAALVDLWRSPEWRARIATRSKEIVRTLHSPQECAKRYAEALEGFYAKDIASVSSLIASLKISDALPDIPADRLELANSIDRSIAPKFRMKQLLVDISELCQHDAKSGIQRVVRSILKQWLQNPPIGFRVEPVYATADKVGYYYARQFTLGFLDCPPDSLLDEPIAYGVGDIFVGLDFQPSIVPLQKAALRKLHNAGVKVKFVIYDMLLLSLPDCFPSHGAGLFTEWLKVVTQFDSILCISRAVQDELALWIAGNLPRGGHLPQLDWFHLGADIIESEPTTGMPPKMETMLEKLKNHPTFLMVGTLEPRKAHTQALEAFEELWDQGERINLVFIGKQGWMVENLVERLRSHPRLNDHLFWMEGVSDEALEAVYGVSTCLLAASKGEGFGLPLIEAAQHSLPIIARDLPVFREVAGENAYYFGSDTPSALAQVIAHWLDLYRRGEHRGSDSMTWMTWSESAQALSSLAV
jgi:glycosyltransferase involved in cell wall biosynthesis